MQPYFKLIANGSYCIMCLRMVDGKRVIIIAKSVIVSIVHLLVSVYYIYSGMLKGQTTSLLKLSVLGLSRVDNYAFKMWLIDRHIQLRSCLFNVF